MDEFMVTVEFLVYADSEGMAKEMVMADEWIEKQVVGVAKL